MNEKTVFLHPINTFTRGKRQSWFSAHDDNPFRDVFPSTQYYDDILEVCHRKWMLGTSAKKFAPSMLLTKGMMVTVLHRMAGTPEQVGKGTFKDVPRRGEVADAVYWAFYCGLIDSRDANLFGINDDMTKEQVVALFRNYAFFKGYESFADASFCCSRDVKAARVWPKAAMRWAVDIGVIKDNNPLRLISMCRLTRGEFASMLVRFCETYRL